MEASRPEHMLVEREANRVAKEAADALRESRRQARRNDLGIPTWTGRFGGQPRFGSPARTNGSESLFARMTHRQPLDGSASESPALVARSGTSQAHVLIGQIREFLAQKGGVASSKELVAKFADIKGADAIVEFRKMVKQIAEFKDPVWTLKEEYK